MRCVVCLLVSVFSLSILGAVPATGPLVGQDFKIGPDTTLDSLSICAGSDGYLVVWRDLRDGESAATIRGAFVSTSGVVGDDFVISNPGAVPLAMPVQQQRVAFDGTNFLVVWADARTGYEVRGAFVTNEGAIVNGSDILVATTFVSDTNPQVVFNGFFMAAWENVASPNGGRLVYFAYVTQGDSIGPVQSVPETGPSPQRQSLQFLPVGFGNLIVVQDKSVSPSVTYGYFWGAQKVIPLLVNSQGLLGLGIPIGIAYNNGAQEEYTVLSSLGTSLESSVFTTCLRISYYVTNGGVVTVGDASALRSGVTFDRVPQGDTNLAENEFPRAFYNGSSEFLFLRNIEVATNGAAAYHIAMKRVALDGTDGDPHMPVLDSAQGGVLNGAVAAAIGSQYLVAWMDGRREPSDPIGQTNIYGVFVNGDVTGDESRPYVKAVAQATPLSGEAPLSVLFYLTGSTGIVDSINWDLGDGTTTKIGSVVHKYTASGTYMAKLALERAGLFYRDYTTVFVGATDVEGGGGGPPQVIGGELGPVSSGVNTQILVTGVSVGLNFTTANADTLRVTGWFDTSVLPVSTVGANFSLTLAGKTYTCTLDSTGTYFHSVTGVKPALSFQMNSYSGLFLLTTTSDDLVTTLAALGAGSGAAPKKDIAVPLSLSLSPLAYDASITAVYSVAAGKSGRATYSFGSQGSPGVGFCHIFNAKVKETVIKKAPVHSFTIYGNIGLAGGVELTKADTGNWQFTLGNYSASIPVASLSLSGDIYSIKGAKPKAGLTQFLYNRRNGAFAVSYTAIEASGEEPSGMPSIKDKATRADMAFSVDFDLENNQHFQAAAFVRLLRAFGAPKWKLR